MNKDFKTLIYNDRHYLANVIFSGLKSKNTDVVAVQGRGEGKNVNTIKTFYNAIFKRRIIAWVFFLLYTAKRRFCVKSNEYDELMVVGIEDFSDLVPVYRKFYNVKNLYFWQWNPQPFGKLKSFDFIIRIFLLKVAQFKVATFDRKDAVRNNLMFHPQIYSKQIVAQYADSDYSHTKKAVFLGMNKGRAEKLSLLATILNNLNIDTNFKVVDQRPSAIIKKLPAISLVDKPVHYEQYLEDIRYANILVEINQSGQQGLTLRTLESIFFSKKLITDNISIADYDFYNKKNIFIIDFSKKPEVLMSELAAFTEDDYSAIESNILEKYDVSSLLQFFRAG